MMSEETIRKDERRRLAALIEASAGTIGAFASSPEGAVKLVAYMIGLGVDSESYALAEPQIRDLTTLRP